MIKFRFPEESQILSHYADKLNNTKIEEILKTGLKSSAEAEELAQFFWKVVDQSADDHQQGVVVLGFSNLESWCEDIMQSLRSHFIATGYIDIWERESDNW